jgi:hypothetical protein
MHAAVKLGDSLVEMGEAATPMPQAFSLYVEDPDATHYPALAAGATPLWEPADQPYGERTAGLRDPFGNQWFPGRRILSYRVRKLMIEAQTTKNDRLRHESRCPIKTNT